MAKKTTMGTVRAKLEDEWEAVRSDLSKFGDHTRRLISNARKHDGHFRALRKREKVIMAQMGRWRKAGEKAERNLERDIQRSMRSLRTAVKKAVNRI